jgi:branched-chain amino acid transport system substrate-binding protein
MREHEARELLQAFQAGKISRRELIARATVLGLSLSVLGGLGARPAAAATAVKIGVDLPMSGGEAPNGVPTNNGVLMAIDEVNKAQTTYTFSESLKDDAVNGVHDPAQGAKNVQELIADSSIVGIVGNFNSNVAQACIPITNAAGIVQISPSQTNPTLTKPPAALQLRKANPSKINYFRVCATDDLQGPVCADYMYRKLGVKKLAILDDQETYGKGIADQVEMEFKKVGGTVASHDGIPKGTQDFHAILTKIKSAGPDALFFGGVTTTGGGLIRKQMADVGLNVKYMGGDGIVEDEFLKVAGDTANGSYGTVAAIDASKVPSAQDFLKAYKARFNADAGAYSANGYVAANIIMAAVKAVGTDREKVRAWVAELKGYQSILGTFGFDQNGDTTNRIISVYTVQGGKWTWTDQVNFSA